MKSDSFCVHPWTNLLVNNPGNYDFCCITHRNTIKGEDGQTLLVDNGDTPEEAWNATSIRNARKAMLNGEKLDICKNCWHQESVGKESYRTRHNNEWEQRLGKEELERRIQYSLDNDYTVDTTPDYLDLRLGNICNLKCRMCNPWNSNQIEKEHNNIKTNNKYADIWSRQTDSNINIPDLKNDWVEGDELWRQLNSYIPKLKKVYFTGGEPTLVEDVYNFMKEIIDMGYQDKIDIMFNTNCTNLQPRFIEKLSKFRTVQINASIDAYGETNNYIRYPSNWKAIDKNIQAIAELPNVHLDISPVIMIYNVLQILRLLQWVEWLSQECGKVIDVDFLYCQHPTYLDPMNLSERVRGEAFISLFRAQEMWLYKNSEITRNNVDSYLNMLEGDRNENWEQNMKDFWDMTEIWDKTRGQSFRNVDPNLWELLRDSE